MAKPFKVDPTPTPNKPANEPVQPMPKLQPAHPLPNANEGAGAAIGHSPPIPWPQPVPGVDHKPFKTSQ